MIAAILAVTVVIIGALTLCAGFVRKPADLEAAEREDLQPPEDAP